MERIRGKESGVRVKYQSCTLALDSDPNHVCQCAISSDLLVEKVAKKAVEPKLGRNRAVQQLK